jgi:hypothetical protein
VTPVEKYLQRLVEIRSSGAGTDETSYYTALHSFFEEVGKSLKPRVRCVLQLKNSGAGHPDGGFYTPDQFQNKAYESPIPGQNPSRGAIEVKPTKDDAFVTAQSDQVTKYWKEYGQVLVTNYRDFVLVARDMDGNPVRVAPFRIAPDEKSFWKAAAQPKKTAAEIGERLLDFLKLAMSSQAVMTKPEEVAWVLAYYAREAKWRVEAHSELEALATVRGALEQALGIKFEGTKGEHFFRSTLVQTLFYGVFSSWVLWSKQHPPKNKEKFDWKLAQWSLKVPMIRALFEEVATPGKLGPLGVVEVLDWTAAALNRVDRGSFFMAFQEQEAVQYFYEPFLEAFDPKLRKELGVWYTPIEVVKYMVARTDQVLREELHIEDGLANSNVYVLDPACGTGAYLVAALNTVRETLKAKGDDDLVALKVKQAAMNRVFGFEILPAPFVISHLQLGLILQNLGAPLSTTGTERVGVYLTNSLTGWKPPKGAKLKLAFPEMEAERDAADQVKREAPILVVIGNPPYNAFAGVSPAEEEGLVEPYKGMYFIDKVNKKTGKTVKAKTGEPVKVKRYKLSDPESQGGWDIRKFNLDDLYVRFFRLAERRITEGKPNKGVISYISNFSYLSDPSYAIMRKRMINGFEKIWVDSMNGDSRETGKTTPDGKPDPSVFSTESNREGIQLGTAICVMVRGSKQDGSTVVRYRDFWGVTKRKDLMASLNAKDIDAAYQSSKPSRANRYSLRPTSIVPEYDSWPRPIDFCAEAPISGLQEMRREALIDIDKSVVRDRAKGYFDSGVTWDEMKGFGTALTQSTDGFDAPAVRKKLQEAEKFSEDRVLRYQLYPLDARWCYWTPTPPLWNRPRPALAAQRWDDNAMFVVRMFAERAREHAPLIVTKNLPDYHLLRPNAVAIPFRLKHEQPQSDDGQIRLIKAREDVPTEPTANLSDNARQYLAALGLKDPDHDASLSSAIWLHSAAIGYSPLYLSENTSGIRYNWPRIPLPDSSKLLLQSAELGRALADLLDTDTPVKGVTSGLLRLDLKAIANFTLVAPASFDPDEPTKHLKIKAGWGHEGKDGITMPGKGHLAERKYKPDERESFKTGGALFGFTPEQMLSQLGESTFDIYLNDNAYWRNIPQAVWEYTIGGYQVLKKWLSYREFKLLGRAITTNEADLFRDMVRRITAICLMQPAFDANYTMIKAATYTWPATPDLENVETNFSSQNTSDYEAGGEEATAEIDS